MLTAFQIGRFEAEGTEVSKYTKLLYYWREGGKRGREEESEDGEGGREAGREGRERATRKGTHYNAMPCFLLTCMTRIDVHGTCA